MNILILGATGRVGSHILTHALQDGHSVTALVRSPDKVLIKNKNLTVIAGDVLNEEDIIQAMHGIDVVISALSTDKTTTLTDSIPSIISAMENEGIKRIVTIGTAGILKSRTQPGLLRYQSKESKRRSNRAAKEHYKLYESLERSTLEWTIVCPTYLPDEEYTGQYRIEVDMLPEEGSKISVADTAEFAYSQINSDKYLKSRVGIAY